MGLGVPSGAGGSGAPTTAPYVTTAADGGLSAEAVLGTAVIMSGTNGSRPAAGTEGRLYRTTDNPRGFYRDSGTVWDPMGEVVIRKTADQSVDNSTTLVSDTDLVLPVLANQVYFFQMFLGVVEDVDSNIKVKFDIGAATGTTMRWGALGGDTNPGFEANAAASGSGVLDFETTTRAIGIVTGGVTRSGIALAGWIFVSSTPGNITLQWAQNTAVDGTLGTTVHANSLWIARRLA